MSGSGFDAVGVAGIITAIVAPLAAVMIAQQLSRRDSHQRLAMSTFYRVTKDVDRLRIALIAMVAHSFQHRMILSTFDRIETHQRQATTEDERRNVSQTLQHDGERYNRETELGIVWLRRMRNAVSAIKADCLVTDRNQKFSSVESFA